MGEKCVQIIPSVLNILFPYKADLNALETIIKIDVENKKKPLIVFARAGNKVLVIFDAFYINVYFFLLLLLGAHVTGQMDDIANLKELCSKYSIWFHISGDNLSGLALSSHKTEVCLNNDILI